MGPRTWTNEKGIGMQGKKRRARTERRRLKRELEKEARRRGGMAFVSERATVQDLEVMLRHFDECPECRKLAEESRGSSVS